MRYAPACGCGQPVTETLSLLYSVPRAEYAPDAMDPWRIHGMTYIHTCGAPGCEADAHLRELQDIATGRFGAVRVRAPVPVAEIEVTILGKDDPLPFYVAGE